MVHFVPLECVFGFIGGILICAATSLNMLAKGRITGFSNLFFKLISFEKSDMGYTIPFFLGLF